MPRSHSRYAPEFQRQMVELVRSERTREELSREFEQAFHPDSSPDDLSVPNLQTEANQPKIAEESVRPS